MNNNKNEVLTYLNLSYQDFTVRAQPTSSFHNAMLILTSAMSATGLMFSVVFGIYLASFGVTLGEHIVIFVFSAVILVCSIISFYAKSEYDPFEVTSDRYNERVAEIRRSLDEGLVVIIFWLMMLVLVLYLIPLAIYTYIYINKGFYNIDKVHGITFGFFFVYMLVTFISLIVGILFLIYRTRLVAFMGYGREILIKFTPLLNNNINGQQYQSGTLFNAFIYTNYLDSRKET